MATFDFITTEDLRVCLESDFQEMKSCATVKAWKAVHVIAGSIIESVLIDALIAEGHVTLDQGLKLDLGGAIDRCREKTLITDRTSELSSVIKGYRNLIHPGRALRLDDTVDFDSSQVVQALVNMVLEDVARKKRKSYGYTAEQIVTKIENDSSASAIVTHLLKETNETEIERLMMKVLPEHYLTHMDYDYREPHVLEGLCVCFRSAFTRASEDLKKRVAQHFVTLFKEESDRIVLTYGTAFLRMTYLNLVPKDDAEIVKQHLLSRLNSSRDLNLILALDGIGLFLKSSEIDSFIDPLVRIIFHDDNDLKEQAESCIKNEWWRMPKEIDQALKIRINAWIDSNKEKGSDEKVVRLEEIMAELDTPF